MNRGDRFLDPEVKGQIKEVISVDKENNLVFMGTVYIDFLTKEESVDHGSIDCWYLDNAEKDLIKYEPAEVE